MIKFIFMVVCVTFISCSNPAVIPDKQIEKVCIKGLSYYNGYLYGKSIFNNKNIYKEFLVIKQDVNGNFEACGGNETSYEK